MPSVPIPISGPETPANTAATLEFGGVMIVLTTVVTSGILSSSAIQTSANLTWFLSVLIAATIL